MLRISRDEIADLYCCPRCHRRLIGMDCLGCGMRSQSVDGVPVLVDFDESVLDPNVTLMTEAASPITRGGRSRIHPQVAANLGRLVALLSPASRVLVVGGGEDAHGLRPLVEEGDVTSITFDIYASALTDFVADAHSIPLPDESVDCVVIQAVLEHVLDPWRVVAEIHRVLRSDGVVYAETPFMQQVHEGAYDFTRFTESGHRWLFRRFHLIESGAIGGPVLVSAWTVEYLLRGLKAPRKIRSLIRRIFNWFSRFDPNLNQVLRADCASAVYFLGRKSNTPISPADIIAFFYSQSSPGAT